MPHLGFVDSVFALAIIGVAVYGFIKMHRERNEPLTMDKPED